MITELKKPTNKDAIKLLEDAILKIKEGQITQIALSWVTSNNEIAGDISDGKNNIMIWASIEHTARECYKQIILEE